MYQDYCPICHARLKHEQYFEEAWGSPLLAQEIWECPKGHYYWEYAYGSYIEVIGDKEFIWSDDETNEHFVTRNIESCQAIYDVILAYETQEVSPTVQMQHVAERFRYLKLPAKSVSAGTASRKVVRYIHRFANPKVQ